MTLQNSAVPADILSDACRKPTSTGPLSSPSCSASARKTACKIQRQALTYLPEFSSCSTGRVDGSLSSVSGPGNRRLVVRLSCSWGCGWVRDTCHQKHVTCSSGYCALHGCQSSQQYACTQRALRPGKYSVDLVCCKRLCVLQFSSSAMSVHLVFGSASATSGFRRLAAA